MYVYIYIRVSLYIYIYAYTRCYSICLCVCKNQSSLYYLGLTRSGCRSGLGTWDRQIHQGYF